MAIEMGGPPGRNPEGNGGVGLLADALVRPADIEEIAVLAVDDERNLLSIIASRLQDRLDGLEVVTANNATDAIERLERMEIDCVIGDYKMPGMDGLELLERCRDIDPELPFILFTSEGSEEVAMAAIEAGVTDYLQKNLDDEGFALLASRIENAVAQYRTAKRIGAAQRHVQRVHDYVTDAYLGLDSEWRIVYLDRHAARLLNGERADLVGTSLWEALPDAAAPRFRKAFERAVESGDPAEFRVRYDPLAAHYEVGALPAAEGLSVHLRDITDLVDREQQLEEVADDVAALRETTDALGAALEAAEGACDCPELEAVADRRADLEALVSDLEGAVDRE